MVHDHSDMNLLDPRLVSVRRIDREFFPDLLDRRGKFWCAATVSIKRRHVSIFGDFPGHADGERQGLDRIGG